MTTIALTDQQRQAIQGEPGKLVKVIDPTTNQCFVLLTQDQYDRIQSLLDQNRDVDGTPSPQIAPAMLDSMRAYWRDLPEELLKLRSRKQQWAAYHGDKRLALTRTDVEAYQECFRRGLQRGEFFVARVEADAEGNPPWTTLEGSGFAPILPGNATF